NQKKNCGTRSPSLGIEPWRAWDRFGKSAFCTLHLQKPRHFNFLPSEILSSIAVLSVYLESTAISSGSPSRFLTFHAGDARGKSAPMALKLFNTRARAIEELQPREPGRVAMYCCGPTVHNFAHIGNFRTFVSTDLLRRYLQFKGFAVQHV